MSNYLIETKNLNKKFKDNHVLKGINFSIKENERVAIVGGNGAGKTTLLNILSKNDEKYTGEVINNLSKEEMSFQFQSVNYSDEFTIFDILSMFEYEPNYKKRNEEIFKKLESMDLKEHFKKKTHELSGGQLQKLNLLLTLATKPKLIFFDEIVSGLDQPSIEDIFKLIKEEINGKITTINVSHNPKEIYYLCDRVIFLREGKIIIDKKISEFKTLASLEKEMKKQIIFNDKIDYDSLIREEKDYGFLDDNVIEVNNVQKSYELNEVLKGENNEGISFNIKQGERIGLIGKNGSGKSTLSEIIAGVSKPTKGKTYINVFLKDSNISKKIDKISIKKNKLIEKEKETEDNELKEKLKTKIEKLNQLPRKKTSKQRGVCVGIQFQKQFYPSSMNIRDVVIYNLQANKIPYDEEYIMTILNSVSLGEFIYKSTFELSGGQRQKLNIILTIIKKPSILILDELTTGLDLLAKEKLTDLIKIYLEKTKSTLLMVTHSHEDIQNLVDKVLVLKDGSIVKEINSKKLNISSIDSLLKRV